MTDKLRRCQDIGPGEGVNTANTKQKARKTKKVKDKMQEMEGEDAKNGKIKPFYFS